MTIKNIFYWSGGRGAWGGRYTVDMGQVCRMKPSARNRIQYLIYILQCMRHYAVLLTLQVYE